MSDNVRRTALRAAPVQAGQQKRGAAAPVTTRAQALSGTFRPLQRADNLPDASSKTKSPDDKKPEDVTKAPGDKDDSFFENAKDEIAVEKDSAGSGGDFKPMGGNENAFDANANETTPADNSTGVPKTPSGF